MTSYNNVTKIHNGKQEPQKAALDWRDELPNGLASMIGDKDDEKPEIVAKEHDDSLTHH